MKTTKVSTNVNSLTTEELNSLTAEDILEGVEINGITGTLVPFEYSGYTYDTLHQIDSPDGATENAEFGNASVMNDTYTLVAETSNSDNSGKVYLINNYSGNVVYTITNPNNYGDAADDNFGNSLAISDNYFAVSATGEDTADTSGIGAIYVYSIATGELYYTITYSSESTSSDDTLQVYMNNKYIIGVMVNTSSIPEVSLYVYDLESGNSLNTATFSYATSKLSGGLDIVLNDDKYLALIYSGSTVSYMDVFDITEVSTQADTIYSGNAGSLISGDCAFIGNKLFYAKIVAATQWPGYVNVSTSTSYGFSDSYSDNVGASMAACEKYIAMASDTYETSDGYYGRVLIYSNDDDFELLTTVDNVPITDGSADGGTISNLQITNSYLSFTKSDETVDSIADAGSLTICNLLIDAPSW